MGDRLARALTGAAGAADLDGAARFGRVMRAPDVADVADVVGFLVSSGAVMVTGQRIEVTGGRPFPGNLHAEADAGRGCPRSPRARPQRPRVGGVR
jgi:NAD(P)-dependent dehydrogenase (short-subunit alcohol dehydrogenase family)